jgi:hypothetical protein
MNADIEKRIKITENIQDELNTLSDMSASDSNRANEFLLLDEIEKKLSELKLCYRQIIG